jgi:predicted dinucleotide-binding enzyme
MHIAVIGAGSVGTTLAQAFARAGHDVVMGVRDSSAQKAGLPGASVADAAAGAEIVVLATPWEGTRQAITACGDLTGKIVVDCTNPIKADFSGLEIGHTTSGAEVVAAWSGQGKVVKCFNTTGFDNMANPGFPGGKAAAFAAGNDREAVAKVVRLANEIGFDAIDAGPLVIARQLEQLAWLWIHLAIKQGMGREFAFGLLRR